MVAAQQVAQVETEKKKQCSCQHSTTLFWCGPGKNIPVMHFRPDVCLYKNTECTCNKLASRGVGLTYKLVKTECRLLRQLLEGHGFKEVHQNSNDFNIMWCGCHVKPYTLRGLTELQKVNHFPRSYEITRKDRIYKNFMRMRQLYGAKHYDFQPVTFVLPSEVNEFYSNFQREKGYWIAKPVASSRGRGITIISHPNQISLEEQTVVCKYISNPLLVDGFKFDLRIYVMVTSFDPLRVYIFNEGLARFSTVRYDGSPLNLSNMFMHLTNYSVNKKNHGYVKCSDPDIEDYGNKWSMSALLRYLKNEGYDTASMMMKTEDMIIKTILSAEIPIANACRMFLPHRENCFELFGFDVIFDEDARPWLLEVNLSPSLACESPLDLKIKSNLVSHMLTLAGVIALEPYSKRDLGNRRKSSAKGPYSLSVDGTNAAPLSNEDLRLVRQTKEEFVRKGAFTRIFPTEDSWDLYSQFLENKTHYNFMLHSQLYPNRARDKNRPTSAIVSMSKFREINTTNSKMLNYSTIYNGIRERYVRYETSLQPLGTVEDYPPEALQDTITPDFSLPSDTISTDTFTDDTRTDAGEDSGDDVSFDKAGVKVEKRRRGEVEKRRRNKQGSKSTTDLSKVRPSPDKVSQKEDRSRDRSAPEPDMKVLVTFDPSTLIGKASCLSKVQARTVFATYLGHIQDNLNEESDSEDNLLSANHSTEHRSRDLLSANHSTEHRSRDLDNGNSVTQGDSFFEDQMDTVVKFLKRASANLHLQVFRVIVPSKKLPLSHRRRILSKELGDFVHIYNKETEQMTQKTRMRALLVQPKEPPADPVSEVELQEFLAEVGEPQLEELLSGYCKTHPNSSLFFGEVKNDDLNCLMKSNKRRKKQKPVKQQEDDALSTEFADKCMVNVSQPITEQNAGHVTSSQPITAARSDNNNNNLDNHVTNHNLSNTDGGGAKSCTRNAKPATSNNTSNYSNNTCSNNTASLHNGVEHKPSRPKSGKPNSGASRKAIDDALCRLNKRSRQPKQALSNVDQMYPNESGTRSLKRSSVSSIPSSQSWSRDSHSPYYSRSVSSSTVTSLASRASEPLLSRDSRVSLSRDSRSRDSRSARSKPKPRYNNLVQPEAGHNHGSEAGSRPRSEAARRFNVDSTVNNKTVAQLKNSRSKRFVQSVWTKEFCKLMDLRMYSHT